MTDDQLNAIRERYEKAVAGAWYSWVLAGFHTDIPALLAEVHRLKEMLKLLGVEPGPTPPP